MNTVAEVLSSAAESLSRAGIDTARLDAEVLLASAMNVSRSALFARLRDPFEPSSAPRFDELLARRRQSEPVAYIVGGREFWSLWFEVTPQTLVPRPETELLIDAALEALAAVPSPRVLDIGTGSGCIACALAAERPDLRVTAIDVSADALSVARRNAERHGVAHRIRFECADVRGYASAERFDLIAANPPYVRRADIESLPSDVRRWEPRTALDGGDDGLDTVRAVLNRARDLLCEGGVLMMEIGCDQGDDVLALAAGAGFRAARIRTDYAHLPRLLVSGPASPLRRPVPS